jgi:alpha-ribazole phosphatase/probable phosphoglycerate mutase
LVTIIFEAHSTTFDNEAHLASGWGDVDLSPLGIDQSKELGDRYHGKKLDAIFISDLIRAFHTAEIAFYGKGIPIIQDKRLRECDYGDLTQHPSSEVDKEKPKRINVPFPNGESYAETTARMRSFLEGLIEFYDGKTVMIIGHRATQYALENIVLGKPLEEVIPAPWKWQPGWEYQLQEKMLAK